MDFKKYAHIRDYDEVCPHDKRTIHKNYGVKGILIIGDIIQANNERDKKAIIIDSLLEPIKEYRKKCETLFKINFEWHGVSIDRNPLLEKLSRPKSKASQKQDEVPLFFEPDFQSEEKPKLVITYKANGNAIVEKEDPYESMKAINRLRKVAL